MRLAGKEIRGPNSETIVIPRGDGEPIIFKAVAILDYSPFDKLCPRPEPPTIMRKGGIKSQNVEDPKFKLALTDYGRKKIAWIVITSLRNGTPDLEWDKVKYSEPDTWPLYEPEFKEAGFSNPEIQAIIDGVMTANCLDDDKLAEARKTFLASVEEAIAQSSSPTEELQITPSGVPVKD